MNGGRGPADDDPIDRAPDFGADELIRALADDGPTRHTVTAAARGKSATGRDFRDAVS